MPVSLTATSAPSKGGAANISGLSSGVKAGIAFGVISAMLLGVLAGWLILGSRARMNNFQRPPSVHPPMQITYHEPVKAEDLPQKYSKTSDAELVVSTVRYELASELRSQY